MDGFPDGHVIHGKYKVIRQLGKGGMGFVVAAENLGTRDLVALKFLRPSLRDDPEIAERFEKEARTAARIKNEHVARVIDVVTADEGTFIVMEHLDGEDLATVLRKKGPLPVVDAIDFALQACEATHEAHVLGIVHRDIKPSNLFVITSGHGRPFIKMLDFGIAKSVDSDVSTTASHTSMGSPRYMSPEQFESAKSADARADVWALGLVLYELLCATPAFPGDTYTVVYEAVRKGEYAPPSTHAPDVPAELEKVLREALKTDRNERIPTVEAFAAKLVPFGDERARASYDRIVSRTAHARVQRAEAGATISEATTAPEVDPTVADPGTGPAVAESISRRPPPKTWGPGVTVGAALALAAVAAGVPYALVHRAHPAAPSLHEKPEAAAAVLHDCTGGATVSCEAACAEDLPGSCFDLAHGLEKGIGAPKDTARAATIYQAACDADDARACNSLGGLYESGDGVAHDDLQAVRRYKSACDLHNGAGCANLGSMQFYGKGVPADPALGVQDYLTGCEEGEPGACYNASIAFEKGWPGAPPDLGQSFTLAQEACAGGVELACVRVSRLKIAGSGTTKDVTGGIAELKAQCKPGATLACEALVGLYARGSGTDVPMSTALSQVAARKGCDAGSQKCCEALKDVHAVSSTATTVSVVLQGLEKSCDKGDLIACMGLGMSLISGNAGVVDKPRGVKLLKKACAGGVGMACEELKKVK